MGLHMQGLIERIKPQKRNPKPYLLQQNNKNFKAWKNHILGKQKANPLSKEANAKSFFLKKEANVIKSSVLKSLYNLLEKQGKWDRGTRTHKPKGQKPFGRANNT